MLIETPRFHSHFLFFFQRKSRKKITKRKLWDACPPKRSSRDCVLAGYLEIIASQTHTTFCCKSSGCEKSLTCSGIQSCPHPGQFFIGFSAPQHHCVECGKLAVTPCAVQMVPQPPVTRPRRLWAQREGDELPLGSHMRFQQKWRAGTCEN